MKIKFCYSISVIVMLMFLVGACEKEEEEDEKQTDRYSFWKGDIDNFYYILDINREKLHLVKGKPFMILEYDPVTGVPIRCEFGLSDAKNEYLDGVEGAIPEAFMTASSLEYAKKLNLTGSVSPLSNWTAVTTNTELSSGGYEFSIDKGSNMWGHEILQFTYTFEGNMAGEIINETATWGGRVSDIKAFKLNKLFSSGTVQ
jgi:hypothetical protein